MLPGCPAYRSCTPLGPCPPSHRVTPRILGLRDRFWLSDISDFMLFGSACVTVSNFEFVCYRVCYRPNFSRVWRPSLEFRSSGLSVALASRA